MHDFAYSDDVQRDLQIIATKADWLHRFLSIQPAQPQSAVAFPQMLMDPTSDVSLLRQRLQSDQLAAQVWIDVVTLNSNILSAMSGFLRDVAYNFGADPIFPHSAFSAVRSVRECSHRVIHMLQHVGNPPKEIGPEKAFDERMSRYLAEWHSDDGDKLGFAGSADVTFAGLTETELTKALGVPARSRHNFTYLTKLSSRGGWSDESSYGYASKMAHCNPSAMGDWTRSVDDGGVGDEVKMARLVSAARYALADAIRAAALTCRYAHSPHTSMIENQAEHWNGEAWQTVAAAIAAEKREVEDRLFPNGEGQVIMQADFDDRAALAPPGLTVKGDDFLKELKKIFDAEAIENEWSQDEPVFIKGTYMNVLVSQHRTPSHVTYAIAVDGERVDLQQVEGLRIKLKGRDAMGRPRTSQEGVFDARGAVAVKVVADRFELTGVDVRAAARTATRDDGSLA